MSQSPHGEAPLCATLALGAFLLSRFSLDTGSVGGKRSAKKQLKMPHRDTADPQISGQINALIKKYAEGVNNNDAAAVAALCTEEAVFVTPEGLVYGRQDIEEWITDAFQRHPKDFSNPPDQRSPHMIGTTGDAVWSTGNWGEALQGPNGLYKSRATGRLFLFVTAVIGSYGC